MDKIVDVVNNLGVFVSAIWLFNIEMLIDYNAKYLHYEGNCSLYDWFVNGTDKVTLADIIMISFNIILFWVISAIIYAFLVKINEWYAPENKYDNKNFIRLKNFEVICLSSKDESAIKYAEKIRKDVECNEKIYERRISAYSNFLAIGILEISQYGLSLCCASIAHILDGSSFGGLILLLLLLLLLYIVYSDIISPNNPEKYIKKDEYITKILEKYEEEKDVK